jgi:heat shock protein HtpX
MDNSLWRHHTLINRLQTLLLLFVMAGFLALLGWMLWGYKGLLLLIIAAVLLMMFSPGVSPKMIMRLYRARPLPIQQASVLYEALGILSERAQLKHLPVLYYIPSNMINAFALGSQNDVAIAVSDALLRRLNLREVVGVLAHEVSHIRSNDLFVMNMADLFSRLTAFLSLFGQIMVLVYLPLLLLGAASVNWLALLLLILAPQISTLAQFRLSRTREFDADMNAAALTGDPEGLARALMKIDRVQGGWLERIMFPGRRIPEPSLLRTHPETEERVRRLMALEQTQSPLFTPVFSPTQLQNSGFWSAGDGKRVDKGPGWHISGLWH